MRKCDTCGELVSGSHYHCGGCDSTDTTGMYGHHTEFCRVTKTRRTFHHCAPASCELDTTPGATA